MRNKNKKIFEELVLYLLGSFGSKMLNILLVPIYTRVLVPNEYGSLELISTLKVILIPILSLQLVSAVYRYLIDVEYDESKIVTTFFSYYFIMSFAIFTSTCVIVLLTNIPNRSFYIMLMILLVIIDNFFDQWLRATDKLRVFTMIGIIRTLFLLILNIYFIIFKKIGYMGIVYSNIIVSLVINLPLVYITRLNKKIKISNFSIKLFKDMIKYSIPLIPNRINFWIIEMSDRLIITYLIGLNSLGIYSAANKFSAIINLLNAIFYQFLQKYVLSNKNTRLIDLNSIINNYIIISNAICMVIIANLKIIVKLVFGTYYFESWKYAQILVLATVFQGISSYLGLGYLKNKKTAGAFYTTLLSSIINVIINLLMMKRFGLIIASISTLISFSCLALVRILTIAKKINVKIEYVNLSLGILINFTIIGLNYLDNQWMILKVILIIGWLLLNIKNFKLLLKGVVQIDA